MKDRLVNQHKRLAMGDSVTQGYARGGSVNVTGAGPMITRPAGRSQSALTTARHNNGVPGMKKGGKCK